MTAAAAAWRFAIAGDACPQLALRLLGLFAQQDLLPAEVTIRHSDEGLDIAIVQSALDCQRAGIIADKMRAMIMVREVVAARV
jgi:hypothetical protein